MTINLTNSNSDKAKAGWNELIAVETIEIGCIYKYYCRLKDTTDITSCF